MLLCGAALLPWFAQTSATAEGFEFFGRTGDVIAVDLRTANGGVGSNFTGLNFDGLSGARVPSTTDWTGQSFASSGVFFLAPSIANNESGDASADDDGFQGVITGSVLVDGVETPLSITVQPGYSGDGPHAVVQDTDRVSVARQQHRLNYLGYRGFAGAPLLVDGVDGNNTQSVTRVFQAAFAAGGSQQPTSQPGNLGPQTTAWLNADNAPAWVELIDPDPQPGFFSVNNFLGDFDILPSRDPGSSNRSGATPNPERWATSWTIDTIFQFTAVTPGTQMVNALTALNGYDSSAIHFSHQSGMDLDLHVDVSTWNFGNGVVSSAEQYVADTAVSLVLNTTPDVFISRILLSNQDILGEINRQLLALGRTPVAAFDSGGGHQTHLHIDLFPTGRVDASGEALGDFNLDGLADLDDLELLVRQLGGDPTWFNLAGDTGVVDGTDFAEMVTGVLGLAFGDANGDTVVSLLDFDALAAGFGGEATWRQGDFNADGVADLLDFDLMAQNFSGVFTASIPEPTTAALLAALLTAGAAGRARRRRSAWA
ncbi:MAG: PEP-CTERM sorting domain-containing protein [Planctomycetota bacterium]